MSAVVSLTCGRHRLSNTLPYSNIYLLSGLPGRVYESGRATWEQSVHNAPHNHFERCGGARQWGIKSVLGLPIASPNVGRIVVTLYSCVDRRKDEDLVTRLSDEFTRVSHLQSAFASQQRNDASHLSCLLPFS
jgi:hypothetical protein